MARDRMRELLATAQENLRQSGALVPVLLVEGAKESALVAFQEFERTAELRRAQMFAVGVRLVPIRPRRVIAVVNTYWKEDDIELPLTRSLADEPGAGEAIAVMSLDRRGRSRALVCPYERYTRLEGPEIEFGRVRTLRGQADVHLLEAFFKGVVAARSKGGIRRDK